MKWKVVVSLLAVLSLFGVTAHAQDEPKVNIFAGYSYLQANPGVSGIDTFHLNGGSASVAYTFYKPWLSGVADFGGYTNGNILGTGSGTLSTYLFGPRVSYHHFGRITPFAQALFGDAHASSNAFHTTGSQNAFALAVGGGVDYRLMHHLALRPFQVDYLMTRFNVGTTGTQTQNNLRVSTGIVFRF
jgi:hypothetical protein